MSDNSHYQRMMQKKWTEECKKDPSLKYRDLSTPFPTREPTTEQEGRE